MIKLLLRAFVRENEKTSDPAVREGYCVLSGILGIICNMLLFGLKLTLGMLMNSIAIISDSFNNLSDLGSSVITIISSKLANRHPDREHPFGHGRMEYVSSLIISFIIMLVGFQLGKSSIEKIITPSAVEFSPVLLVILASSVAVKLWMFFYNRYLGGRINSTVLAATARDSINDAISTGVVIISILVGNFTSFPVDGAAGMLVSAFILYSGFSLAKDTVDVLLGTPPSKQTVDMISSYVLQPDEIIGIHDLIVHDYGPGRIMATVHAEVPDDANILKIHEIIDDTEQRIYNDTGILTVIHMDPVAHNDPVVNSLRRTVDAVVRGIDEEFSIHDFRCVLGENRINLIFDVVVPPTFRREKQAQLKADISERLGCIDRRYRCVITVDYKYYN